MKSAFLTNPAMRRIVPAPKDRPWELVEDLRYQSAEMGGEILIVPAGYRTDFASCPWMFRRIFPQDGPWSLAAVLHDFLCDMRLPGIDSKRAAVLFREAMEVLGVPQMKRTAMYLAVLWFGPKWS
jgi:hypothetical protein